MVKAMAKKRLEAGALRPNAGIAIKYAQEIVALIDQMTKDVRGELEAVFSTATHHGAMDDKDGFSREPAGSVVSRSRITLNALMAKWETRFNRAARRVTDQMIGRTIRHSTATLGMSLKDLSEDLKLKVPSTPAFQEMVKASTLEATELIKLIPQKYLAEVQGQVMRSITSGEGLKDLVPFLNEKYRQNVKHARNVALDQTRKAYSNINSARLKAIGVQHYIWVHSGGSVHPRRNHIAMNGKEFSLDDPPVIGEMYGREVRGKPGDLPYCRCVMKPIISFEENDDAD
jgi:SPP1 gp7 family putative phage head morphogenesis protein